MSTTQAPQLRKLFSATESNGFHYKHRRRLVTRLVPYASVLDLESSNFAKPDHSAF